MDPEASLRVWEECLEEFRGYIRMIRVAGGFGSHGGKECVS